MTDLEILRKIMLKLGIELKRQQNPNYRGYILNSDNKVISLTLNSCPIIDLTGIILQLVDLTHLTSLHLHDTKIRDISLLRLLTNLVELDLNDNPDVKSFEPLKDLRNLTQLYLRSNYIEDISFLEKMTSLKVLVLHNNRVNNISLLKNLTFLEKLFAGSCQIKDIHFLKDLTNLSTLHLPDNEITDIDNLKNLTNLINLNLQNNNIKEIPSWITSLKATFEWNDELSPEGIALTDNPIITPPIEIVIQGKEAIRIWYEGNKRTINETKVLLVGHGDVGKTSLVSCLKGEKPNADIAPTHHINITNKTVNFNNKKITLHFWDFGGQEVMHSTHQFFLSSRSIYILVLDGRRDEEPEYWLKHIESFGGHSPVLVVMNKSEDANPAYDVDRRFLQEKYPCIIGFYKTVCKGKVKGVTEVEKALIKALEKVELLSVDWLEGWLKVKEELEKMDDDFISQTTYEKLCEKYEVNDDFEKDLLAGYLNDLGVVVHFKDLHLANLHILQPRWASRAAYKIINSGLKNGILNIDGMSQIMKKKDNDDFEYKPAHFPFILDLMQKFELCYPVIEKKQYLIPALLDIQQPELPTLEGPVLRFFFRYEDLLPRSVLLRFIVRMHNDIYKNLRWRTGVTLSVPIFKSIAIVIADLKERRISVSVSGPRRREHFAIIRKTFHDLHGVFERLKVTEWIPLPDFEGHEVEYQELLGLEEMGIETITIGKLKKHYKVKDLLDGIEPESVRKEEYEWDVFLCHSSKDKSLMNEIASDMKSKGIRYWLDQEQIETGDNIIDKITEGLLKSRNIAPCISAHQLRSGWSKNEYQSILGRVISGSTKQRVLPLILDNTIDDDIPLFLGNLKFERYNEPEQYQRFISTIQRTASRFS
jgi:internalin A